MLVLGRKEYRGKDIMEKYRGLFPTETQYEMKMQLKYLCSETIDHHLNSTNFI